jgi:hypothetical protein
MPTKEEILEAMAVLLRAAEADSDFGMRLRVLLQLPSFQRASIVNTSVQEMRLRGESEDVCSAFTLLATDTAAELALRYLAENGKSA